MGNIWSANSLLGLNVDEHIHTNSSKQKYIAHAQATAEAIVEKFPRVKTVANTFRFDHDGDNVLYYTHLFDKGTHAQSADFTCKGVVDRSGSGDCFMAGIIYGLYNQNSSQEILDYATAAAFGKLQEYGDSTGQDILSIKKMKQ